MKIWLALFVEVLSNSAGNIFLTKGMKQVGEINPRDPKQWMRFGRRAMANPMLGLGLFCMTLNFFLFIALLSWADLSFVVPVTATSYILSVIGAQYILKENVTPARLIGSIFIGIGVALLALNSGAK